MNSAMNSVRCRGVSNGSAASQITDRCFFIPSFSRESRYFSKTSASEMQRDGVLRYDVRNSFKVSCRCDLVVIVPGVAFRHTAFWKAGALLPSNEKKCEQWSRLFSHVKRA